MTNNNDNQLNLRKCFQRPTEKFMVRAIFKGEGAPEQKSAPEKKSERIVDLDQFKNQTEFKPDRTETLRKLALQDDVLAKNFEVAIQESLDKQGYDGKIEDFWKEMEKTYNCKKVDVKDGRIHFLNDKGVEVAPKFSVVPIIIDLSKFNPDTPRSKYYNPDTGLVSFKSGAETHKITVADIVMGARDGTEIIITKPGGKPRRATFSENGKTAYYDNDGKTIERVNIFDGYKVELVRKAKTVDDKESETYGNYPSAGEYKFASKTATSEGYSAEDFINTALGIDGKMKPGIIDESNKNIVRLREMFKNKDNEYTVEKYTNFLTSKGAIKKDRIALLVDTDFISKKEQIAKKTADENKMKADEEARVEGSKKDRDKYYIPVNLLEKRKFILSDPKLIEALSNPKKWEAAWADGSIEGLVALKGIITSEPDIFGKYAKSPDLIREKLRAAIYQGDTKQIDFSDLIDDILVDIRMPSFAEKAGPKTNEVMKKQQSFNEYYNKLPEDQKNYDEIKRAYGFLKKLGPDVLNTATAVKVEGHTLRVNFIFEGNAYSAITNDKTAAFSDTLQLLYFNSTTTLPKGASYENSNNYKVSSLIEGDFGPNNEVQKWFRDAVTPPMTYSRFVDTYNANFNPDGSTKNNNMPAAFQDRMRNIIIGGNRFLIQLRDMQFTEKSSGKVGETSFAENREGEVKDEEFLKLVDVDNNPAWEKEWANPTRETTKLLKQTFLDDPVLREIAAKDPNGISKRVQDAITKGKDKYLEIDHVIEYVLKGMRMPSHAPEAKELPKGSKFSEYFKEKKNPNDTDNWSHLVLSSLGSESFSRAVIDNHNDNANVITTTFENRVYTLVLRQGGALTHVIEIKTPDGKPYANSNGYDNSEEYWGNMSDADGPKILNWFRDAVRPPLSSASDFRKEYARLFDAQGNPKPGVTPEVAENFKAIMRASNRLVMAFEGKKESAKESSEGTYATQLLRNSQLPTQIYNIQKVWNADDIYNSYKGEQIYSAPALAEVKNSVGLQMKDDILGPELADTVGMTKNKLALFRAVLQTYSLPELINQGCIKKGKSTTLPNQEFYVVDNLPKTFVDYMKAKTAPGEITNFEKIIANKQNLSAPEYKEGLNPQAKLRRIAETFFPLKESERTYADVGEAKGKDTEKEQIYNRMDYAFAHTQFLKAITGQENGSINAPIDEARMLFMLKSYLEMFDSTIDMYGPEKGAKIRKPFTDVFGANLPTFDSVAALENIMKDPKKAEALSQAVRDGFVFAHERKIDTQREKAIEKLGDNFEKWKGMITEEEYNVLRQSLRDAKIPENEIPLAVEKLLPVWFGLGVDTSNGTFGIAAGVIVPIKLGKNGEYGTIAIGGGVGVGKGLNGLGAGVAAGGAYKTPHLGPFALFAGGGVGVGVDTTGTFGVGGGVGAGVSIEWGTVGATKISSDVGIAYVPGMPFPLPGVTVTFEKNHEASMANLRAESRQKFGLEAIDKELESAKDDTQRKAIISKNEFFKKTYNKAYGDFDKASPADVVAKFKKYEANLDEVIRQNYDPTLFLGLSKIIVGFGLDPESGKFIFLVGGSIATGKEVKTYALEGKKADVMEQEVQISHMHELAKRYSEGGIKEGSKESSEVNSLITSGKLLVIPGSKDLAVYIPKGEAPAPVPVKLGEKAASTEKVEAKFNEKLKPLNLRVEYDPAKKLFELKFMDWNDKTNYDLAVDSKMNEGGIIVDGGHIYLANDFNKVSTLAILRSDYEYPFKSEGKNYRSIITISDSPLTPAHKIYNSSREILSSKGGNWFPQQGSGYDKFATPQASRFYKATEGSKYAFDAAKFESAQGAVPTDDKATTDNINKLSITTAEKGEANEAACSKFATNFLKAHPIDYRAKSNKESKSNNFEDLNKIIETDWEAKQGKKINPAELNLVRLKIMDASFSELGNVKGKARQEAFKRRLEITEQLIMLPRFRLLISENHAKYKQGDPNYIRMKAEDLSRIIMDRVRNIDVNTDAGATALSKIDRTSTVAGTLGILGFRGEVYGGDNKDPNQIMIGSSVDYASFLKNKPESAEADIARLIFEETSKMPRTLTAEALKTPEKSKEGIYDLLRADLSQKVISLLFTPYSKDLFSPGVREEILRLAANKNALTFNDKSPQALAEFQKMVGAIRNAEMSGEKYFIPPNAPDYRFILTTEVHDGVYKKCTNYSMWVNEGLELQLRTSKIVTGPDLTAAYGLSTGTTVNQSQIEFTTINVAAAVAVKVKSDIPPPPPEVKTETPTPAQEGTVEVGAAPKPEVRVPTKPGAEQVTPGPSNDSP